MSNIRMHVKDSYHFITNRTEHEQFMLLPTLAINAIILFWLAKAWCRMGRGIKIFAFVFMSNHFHILLQDTAGELAQFMRYFQSGVAVSVNRHLGRRGRFWAREYDDVILEGDEAFWNRYDYINGNPVKAGLVGTPTQWKGISSYQYAFEGKPIVATGLNRNKYNEAKRIHRDVEEKDFMETWEFNLAQPPVWKHWSHAKRVEAIEGRTRNLCKHLKKQRMCKPVLGMKKVMKENPLNNPKSPKRKPRFKFFCMDPERLMELKDAYRMHVGYYKSCVNALFNCGGNVSKAMRIEWPPWSYPPTRHVPLGF